MKAIWIPIISIFPIYSQAQSNTANLGFNPPSLRWRQIKAESGKIIYPVGLDSLAFRLADIMAYERTHDASIVGSGKTKKVPVILQNQTVFPEGFSTPAPWRNEYFIMPPQNLFQGPTTWTDLLAIHEYRHTQQFHMAKGGFTWVLKALMGETGWLLNALANQPLWFREGDAVATETQLTTGGRGRLPRFNMETKALLLSGYHFNYEKGSYGISFKDYVPNPYRPGFYMTMKLRRDVDDNVWQKVLHDTYHRGLFYSFSTALKRNTELSPRQLYDNTMTELDSFWREDEKNRTLIAFEPLTEAVKNNYTNYRFAHFLPDNSILCLKDAFNQVRSFTTIQFGKEKSLFPYGVYTDDHVMFSAEGNLVSWAEAGYDLRWGNKTYSVIKLYNLATGKTRKLTSKTRYFAPAPSYEGKKIAAVHVDKLNRSSIVVLDTHTGKLLRECPAPAGWTLVQPRWTEGDRNIVLIAVSADGNSLVLADAETGTFTTVLGPIKIPISRPLSKGGYIYFSAGFSGIDNIYALAGSGKLYQVSSVQYGAYEPSISADGKKLLFSNYTAEGYQLATMDLDSSSWKHVDESGSGSTSQPYVQEFRNPNAADLEQGSYKPKRYHALTSGLFKIYGWFPYVGVDQYGVQFQAQNIMNTLKGSITPFYNSEDKALGARVNLTYAAFYPVFLLDAGVETRSKADILDPLMKTVYQQAWNEKFYSAEVAFPFNFTGGNYQTHFNIQGGFGHYTVHFLDSVTISQKLRTSEFGTYTGAISFSRYSQRARRDVEPRWGQAFDLFWRKATKDSIQQLVLGAQLYFPALRTHSFNLSGTYKKEGLLNSYRFTNNFVMPRGYRSTPFEQISVVRANYEFPFWYPDLALGGLAFFQRLRGNFFYDHAVARRFDQDYTLQSAGAELMIDLRALRLFGMTAAFRYSKVFNKDVVNTVPFQFVITRFDIQN